MYRIYGKGKWKNPIKELYLYPKLMTRAITELEHHDNSNIIEKNRYIKSMRKVIFQVMEVSS